MCHGIADLPAAVDPVDARCHRVDAHIVSLEQVNAAQRPGGQLAHTGFQRVGRLAGAAFCKQPQAQGRDIQVGVIGSARQQGISIKNLANSICGRDADGASHLDVAHRDVLVGNQHRLARAASAFNDDTAARALHDRTRKGLDINATRLGSGAAGPDVGGAGQAH